MSHGVKVAVVYHSGYGHTEVMAQAIAKGAEETGACVALISVGDLEQIDWDRLNDADALIFGSPTYMGSVSGQFKLFMDASSKIWEERGWVDKVAAGFTCAASLSGDKQSTLLQMAVFAAQHGMIWVGLDLLPGYCTSTGSNEDLNRMGTFMGAMAQANADEGPDVAPPASDRETAKLLGARVAKITARVVQPVPA